MPHLAHVPALHSSQRTRNDRPTRVAGGSTREGLSLYRASINGIGWAAGTSGSRGAGSGPMGTGSESCGATRSSKLTELLSSSQRLGSRSDTLASDRETSGAGHATGDARPKVTSWDAGPPTTFERDARQTGAWFSPKHA